MPLANTLRDSPQQILALCWRRHRPTRESLGRGVDGARRVHRITRLNVRQNVAGGWIFQWDSLPAAAFDPRAAYEVTKGLYRAQPGRGLARALQCQFHPSLPVSGLTICLYTMGNRMMRPRQFRIKLI